jgi:hypothetical protein
MGHSPRVAVTLHLRAAERTLSDRVSSGAVSGTLLVAAAEKEGAADWVLAGVAHYSPTVASLFSKLQT